MPEPVDKPTAPATRTRGLIVGGAIAALAAIGAVGLAVVSDSAPPPANTTVAPPPAERSTTTTASTSPSTTLPTAAPPWAITSPFDSGDLVSRTNPIPNNPAHPAAAASIYVDPMAGDDAAVGTLDAPVATLEAARTLARAALATGDGDVVVYLREGLHERAATFTLTAEDSGRGEDTMIYRSFPGEQAVIEGGVRVASWERAAGEVMVAAVPAAVTDMRQFFAGGHRQPRARSASAGATALEFLRGPLFDRQRNVAMTVDSELVAGLSHPEDLELVYVGVAIGGHGVLRADGSEIERPSWKSQRLPVTGATDLGDGSTRLDIGNGALYHASERGYQLMKLLPGDPFYIENAIELLDEPGEWFFDPRQRLLYWWPPDPAALEDAWVPVLDVLLAVDGTPTDPVRNVLFEGLAFRHSAYTVPNDEGSVVSQGSSWFAGWEPPEWMEVDGRRHSFLNRPRPSGHPVAAVQIDSSSNVAFRGNVFTELGAVGVMVHNDADRIEFAGNLFVDISAEALVAGHPEHDEIDEPMEGPVTQLHFVNNVVDRAGAEFYSSVALQVFKADGAIVSHNLLRDLPYTALSLGWGWDRNPASTVHRAITVENNYFENVVNLLYDGAPVYLLGPVAEPGAARGDYTEILGNFANNAAADPQFKAPGEPIDAAFAKRPGIQLDEGIRNVALNDNVFLGSTVWLQLTDFPANRNTPGWAAGLALTGEGNWSDTLASVPSDPALAGIDQAQLFEIPTAPGAVRQIFATAGLEPGVAMPPLP